MFRDFINEDYEDFMDMAKEFYCSQAVLHAVTQENFKRTFKAIIDKTPFERGIMFCYNCKKVGYSLLSFTYSNEAGGQVILIEEIFVYEEYRNIGIGTKFFRFLNDEYEGKAKRFRLEVRKNSPAIKLYESIGLERLEYLQLARDL